MVISTKSARDVTIGARQTVTFQAHARYGIANPAALFLRAIETLTMSQAPTALVVLSIANWGAVRAILAGTARCLGNASAIHTLRTQGVTTLDALGFIQTIEPIPAGHTSPLPQIAHLAQSVALETGGAVRGTTNPGFLADEVGLTVLLSAFGIVLFGHAGYTRTDLA